jgi:hypothetical protein
LRKLQRDENLVKKWRKGGHNPLFGNANATYTPPEGAFGSFPPPADDHLLEFAWFELEATSTYVDRFHLPQIGRGIEVDDLAPLVEARAACGLQGIASTRGSVVLVATRILPRGASKVH